MTTKNCSKCKEHFPATNEYFENDKGQKSGLSPACKMCLKKIRETKKEETNKRARENYRLNAEEIKKERRDYRKKFPKRVRGWDKKSAQNNSERVKRNQRDYYAANKEELKEYSRNYYKTNKEILNERQREYYKLNKERLQPTRIKWRKENRERIYGLNNARRVRESKLVNDFTKEEWDSVRNHFNDECAYCGTKGSLTRDHFIPVIKGGGHTASNIIPSCLSCNCSKQESDFIEWYRKNDNYDEDRELSILEYIQK